MDAEEKSVTKKFSRGRVERFVKEERIVVARMSITEGTYECH